MRRSKSNPAKYTKNYRSISQRRMTEHDGVDEEQEIEKLRITIKEQDSVILGENRKRARVDEAADSNNNYENILSKEIRNDQGYGADDNNQLIVVSKKKKQQPKTKKEVTLTPRELKLAKELQKKATRKLKQLESRVGQKEKRKELYAKLQASALSSDSMQFLSSSSTLGKQKSKKEQLKIILRKERAGISLTNDEKELLYQDRGDITSSEDMEETSTSKSQNGSEKAISPTILQPSAKKKCKQDEFETTREPETPLADAPSREAQDVHPSEKPNALSFAAQMMASVKKLKKDEKTKPKETSESELGMQSASSVPTTKPYIPPEPVELKTPAALGMKPTKNFGHNSKRRVREIKRPKELQDTRYDLPVATMEYEVMDAIKSNDVTIICGETGSGKSTQIPQFLYEFGMSRSSLQETGEIGLIGITQPRRVAAVSTAKRVCFEMGCGDGRAIRSTGSGHGNTVAYQTRYETAGLGKATHIKFMTDGILLQEIQSDLLLRKYNVIILDEAHERGLNTDILIGLLSKSIPLRKEASKETGSSLPPLKLIIMSATLRVEDFTSNKNLFPFSKPFVVRVPGRTHPVTIHHSRLTELSEYENAVFKKVCKIHRKLPQGGILVFLTGKQEIVRMVKRLGKSLSNREKIESSDFKEVSTTGDEQQLDSLREVDDDEVDGDIFRREDEWDGVDEDEEVDEEAVAVDSSDGIPDKVTILPLYALLSNEEQAKVFAPVPEGHRLIVVATNIAETSITIPGISYVVDSGRQKCRNFNSNTGVASYDIMWISKAAADQRAGRAGRTGPGHCYRIYSSSMYSRHMDGFSLPEVLVRPLEDVVLSMKAMHIAEVEKFPFPTQPDRSQIKNSIKLLADLGCVNTTADDSDGEVTRLGSAIAKLPLGVRCGKILLVAAQAGVLDYGIAIVAALSEKNPFLPKGQTASTEDDELADGSDDSSDDEDGKIKSTSNSKGRQWEHKAGDMLAVMLAVGAYTYAGRGAGGSSEKLACRKFCAENGLHFALMERIQKMRIHLAGLAKLRLASADSIASKTGGILASMPPPNKVQEQLLCQAIASGFLDNIAMIAPIGSISNEHPFSLRSAFLNCSKDTRDPLFMDRNSVVYSRDSRIMPKWICYESLLKKTLKDGTVISVMKNITPINPSWLGSLARGSKLLSIAEPLGSPHPVYDPEKDCIFCSARTRFGEQGWDIPPVKVEMVEALRSSRAKQNIDFLPDDIYRWFARLLLEGRVIAGLENLSDMLNESPAIITRRLPSKKVTLFVSALSSNGIDCVGALREKWVGGNQQFLFRELRPWVKDDRKSEAISLWRKMVAEQVDLHSSKGP